MESRKYKTDFKERFGVAISTARYQLMNKILFQLLVETNKNCCYRCKQSMTLQNFSLEHKQPWAWEDNGYDLFMDLDNVAFSHRSCNSKVIRQTAHAQAAHAKRKNRRIKGDKIQCTKCLESKITSEFHKNKTSPTGHESLCKPCRKLSR